MRHLVRTTALLAVPALLLALLGDSAPTAGAGDPPGDPARRAVATTAQDGFVRIPAAALAALGSADPARWEVRHRGVEVPRAAGAVGDDLVVLVVDAASDTSRRAVLELRHRGEIRPRPPDLVVAPDPTGLGPTPCSARRVLSTDHVHGPLAAAEREVYDHPDAPTWFLGWLTQGGGWQIDLDPAGAEPGTPQGLEVALYATHPGPVALRARWGGRDLGTAHATHAAGGARLRYPLPADALPSEGTALLLEDVSPPPPPPPPDDASDGRGTLWVDEIALVGPVSGTVGWTPTPLARRLPEDGKPVVLEGDLLDDDGGPRVLVALRGPEGGPVPLPAGARLHPGTGRAADRLVVPTEDLPAGTTLFVSTVSATVEPVASPEPADPLAQAGTARHLILATPALVPEARRLARHRVARGLSSAVVPVEDVYATYGNGEMSGDAIRAFLLERLRADAPLTHVLLAGDATFDRTDLTDDVTIPVPMARTMYNGATPADRLYVLAPDGASTGGPAIGRLPFRDAVTMAAYVDRVIAYETKPPVDPTRRLLRFVTNEGRFGALIDTLMERMFRIVLANDVPAAYDVEITFASVDSPYLWPPPEMGEKVIAGFNEGCLFYTYVGHGFAQGFDTLRTQKGSFPLLHVADVPRVACEGTPPVAFVLACTTATFDQPVEGIGEALLARPAGPLAYWGATRICHPAANTLLGRAIARFMSERDGPASVGGILARARDEVLAPTERGILLTLIDQAIRRLAPGAPPGRLALEGTWMYSLLGDPALAVAFPREDLTIDVRVDADTGVEVHVQGPLADGLEVHVSIEVPRDRTAHEAESVPDPLDPDNFAAIRRNHDRVNDLAIARETLLVEDGEARWQVPLPDDARAGQAFVTKAWVLADDVHQGSATFRVPAR